MKCQHRGSWYVQPAGRLKLRNPSPSGPITRSPKYSKYPVGDGRRSLVVFAVAGDGLRDRSRLSPPRVVVGGVVLIAAGLVLIVPEREHGVEVSRTDQSRGLVVPTVVLVLLGRGGGACDLTGRGDDRRPGPARRSGGWRWPFRWRWRRRGDGTPQHRSEHHEEEGTGDDPGVPQDPRSVPASVGRRRRVWRRRRRLVCIERGRGRDRADGVRRRTCEFHARRVPLLPGLGQRPCDHPVHRRRQVASRVARTRRRVLEVRVDRHEFGITGERHLARQAPVEDAAQRVDVGASVHVVIAPDLLRSDVVDGARERARSRHPGARRDVLRDAEVGEERPAVVHPPVFEQDRRRHDAAVHESFRVCRIEGGGALHDDRERDFGGEVALDLQQPLEVGALHVSHGEVEDPVGFSGVVHRDDVRMVERGRGPAIPDESLPERLVLGQRRVQDLQRDLTSQPQMAGEVHHRHRAAADDRLDPMARKLGAHPRIGLHGMVVTPEIARG